MIARKFGIKPSDVYTIIKKVENSGYHPKMEPTDTFTFYFDGGSRGNPGPSGFGVYSPTDGSELYGYLGTQTNNYAEYSGLIAGLKRAVEQGYASVNAFGDSDLVVKQINGVYAVKAPNIKSLYSMAKHFISKLDEFTITHVYRNENGKADALANKAMNLKSSNYRI